MSLKEKAINGVIWSGIERLSSQGAQFIIGLILARLLVPADYGLIGMITIFTAISQNFIESGFSNALIRKHDRTQIDFSTVFYFNIVVSVICYCILFFTAPIISDFYKQPILVSIIRFVSLNIIIASFAIIQRTIAQINVNYKLITVVSLCSTIISGGVAIYFAYLNYGVWALVIQLLISNLITTILFWIISKWRPLFAFSIESFKKLFGYGFKLLLSRLLDTLFANSYQVIIGKFYNTQSLGFYTRAQGFVNLPSVTLTTVIQRVTFPILSNYHNDDEQLISISRRFIKMTAFCVFPIMLLLFVIAKPLVLLTLTDKWLAVVPILQLLCLSRIWEPIMSMNINILYIKGRSDLFLKIEIIKKILMLLTIFVTYSYGVIGIVIGQVFLALISLYINSFYTKKLISYSIFKQMADIFPILVLALASSAISFCSLYIVDNNVLQITCSGLIMISLYFGLAYIFKIDELNELMSIIKRKLCFR